jgi:hypothetical protein
VNEADEHREVYAYFGLTVFKAQCLEQELINMLSLYALADSPGWTAADVDAVFQKHDELTLAGLLKKALSKVRFAKEMEEVLTRALAKRNMLIHGYWAKRIRHFGTPEGRNVLLRELEDCREALTSPISLRNSSQDYWENRSG